MNDDILNASLSVLQCKVSDFLNDWNIDEKDTLLLDLSEAIIIIVQKFE